MRIVLVPGMGCTPVAACNWYSWFANEMESRPYVNECILRDFPDPHQCKESVWIPFIRDEIGLDESTVVVGHSSGAACAMRLLESGDPKLFGAVLIAAAYTDSGDPHEARSEYFNRPWDWKKMEQGAKHIVLFHGTDDHLIPVYEARYIASHLNGAAHFEYHEMNDKSHFFAPWQELLDVFDKKFGMSIPDRG